MDRQLRQQLPELLLLPLPQPLKNRRKKKSMHLMAVWICLAAVEEEAVIRKCNNFLLLMKWSRKCMLNLFDLMIAYEIPCASFSLNL